MQSFRGSNVQYFQPLLNGDTCALDQRKHITADETRNSLPLNCEFPSPPLTICLRWLPIKSISALPTFLKLAAYNCERLNVS